MQNIIPFSNKKMPIADLRACYRLKFVITYHIDKKNDHNIIRRLSELRKTEKM